MEWSGKQEQEKKNIAEVKIFLVPLTTQEIKENLTLYTNTPSNPSKTEIINQAFKFHSQGNILGAARYYQYFIDQGFNDHRVFSNFGVILKDLGKLKEAENCYRKAIELKPTFAEAHLNLGTILKDIGNLQEAEVFTRKAIELKPDLAEAHSNLGTILKDLGNLQEAEIFARKAIELNSNFADAHSNLGSVLIDLGNLQEAELSLQKAIELKPNFAKAYYSLSTLKYSNNNNRILKAQLFSESILKNKLEKDKIDIYFARANLLHKEKNYEESSRYLLLANKLKLDINPSQPEKIFNQSQVLLLESAKKKINPTEDRKSTESIFIVGMPRSGSTLLESILSTNKNVNDLGEINILEESFLEWKKNSQGLTLSEIYWKQLKNNQDVLKITTNKWLYNYQYAGIISNQILNSKIIHCYRNPLDNILSIYRAHFARGNEYSSSLVDSAYVYLDQDEVMTEYKSRYRSKIYDLNYDLLVSNPNQEIKSLISWLDWKWDDIYLSPHLNPGSVSTSSNVQVRSPINSKSIGGWKNYKDMLKPSIEILTQTDKYRNLIL